MDQNKADNIKRLVKIIGLILFVFILIAFTVVGLRWVWSLRDPEILDAFQQKIASLGAGGWFVLLAIQYVQIVIAFIPGGPIQIMAGALYGPWGGMAVCLAGTLLAASTVFAVVKRYGRRALALFVDEKEILRYKFLQDSKRLEVLVTILFFIPGTPKDALTYLFALTPLNLSQFMILSTLARIPAMLTSVLAGDSISNGRWLKALGLFAGITLISGLGLLLHRRILALHRQHDS